MAGAKRDDIQEKDLQGFKYFQRISAILGRLHGVGCERDRAHNRDLHMDQYMLLLLLYMFNPICVSLRALQQASTLKKVQRVLGVPQTNLGSLSEAARLFDSEKMVGILREVAAELEPMPHEKRLDDLHAILTAVDGTLIRALPRMVWALWKDEQNAVKVHMHYEPLRGIPVYATITEGNANERKALRDNLLSGRLYVMDRGYAEYVLLQDILDAGSHFVCRIRDNAVFEVVEERELSQEALDAGIVRDAEVWLGGKKNRGDLRQPVRIVEIQCTPHLKRAKTGRGGPEQGETLLLATDRLDLDSDLVGLVFRHRWPVETFFNVFKHVLGCRHLLSDSKNGIELQVYAAILACLLIALYTGRKPTRRTYEMLCWYFMGWAEEDELQAHIEGLKKQG